MSAPLQQRDLVILVADKDMEQALRGFLGRRQSLGVRPPDFEVYAHPARDGGCRTQGVPFLRTFCNQFHRALLIFDHEGSGGENQSAVTIEDGLEQDLERNGWKGRCAVIVIEPELEAWIWSDSPEVDQVAGWGGRIPDLRSWLHDEGFLSDDHSKPERPKEAFRHALRHVRKQLSAALFKKLAQRVSFQKCEDRAFRKLLTKLQEWFPEQHP